jgi:hypothetical protein
LTQIALKLQKIGTKDVIEWKLRKYTSKNGREEVSEEGSILSRVERGREEGKEVEN